MTLATKNGAVILKAGKLAENCGCCVDPSTPVCKQYTFSVDWGQFGGFRPLAPCYKDDAMFGAQTVSVPDSISLPASVTITGYADDDLAVNGKSVSLSQCRQSGAVSASLCLNEQSFEIAAIDNFGWLANYDVNVCFSPNLQGACCEGTTCTVKPACECQGTGQTFKGVGTTCATNPCGCCNADGTPKQGSGCAQCWCFCGDGAAAYPRFINVTLSGTYQMFRPKYVAVPGGFQESGREYRDKSFSCSITLSAISTPSRSNCPGWTYGTGSARLPLGNGGATGYVLIDYPTFPSTTSAQFGVRVEIGDLSEFSSYSDWRTSGFYILGSQLPITSTGVQKSGTCFSDIAGSFTASPNGVPNDTATFAVVNGSIAGLQA